MSDKPLHEIIDEFLEEIPELSIFFSGEVELTPESLSAVLEDPDIREKAISVIQLFNEHLDEESDPTVVMPPPGGVGLPRLNPKWESALVERLQFDGDVPEYRQGRLLVEQGQKAAVPVDTAVVNSLMLGLMLQRASEEVTGEAKALLADTETNTKRYLEALDRTKLQALEGEVFSQIDKWLGDESSLEQVKKKTDLDTLKPAELMAVPDPEGYEAGKQAALRVVDKPSITALTSVSKGDAQQAVWAVTATTQGRKSALRPIANLLTGHLRGKLDVEMVEQSPDKPPVIEETWEARLDTASEVNPRFNPLTSAAATLARKLVMRAGDLQIQGRSFTGVVVPIDTVDTRQVGWGVALYLNRDQPVLS